MPAESEMRPVDLGGRGSGRSNDENEAGSVSTENADALSLFLTKLRADEEVVSLGTERAGGETSRGVKEERRGEL